MHDEYRSYDRIVGWTIGSGISTFIMTSILALSLWSPLIAPWAQERHGIAALAKAQHERQIQIAQAKAEKEASQHRAAAIKIVGQAAKDFPEYRKQEFIGAFAKALEDGTIRQIIYVPTEANVPILEAGKR